MLKHLFMLLSAAILSTPTGGYGANSTRPTLDHTIYLPVISVAQDCYSWSGQISLQSAIDQFACVKVSSGVWVTTAQLTMKSGHALIGSGRDTTIIRATSPWTGNGQGVPQTAEAVVHDNGSSGVVIANITVDASSLSTFGVGASGQSTSVKNAKVINAKCDGIAIAGPNWSVIDNIIEHNGKSCPNGLPGSGIYVIKNRSENTYAPLIRGNVIRYNGGPALDVDRIYGGTFVNNTVYENAAWAAISLYSASYWRIEDNSISQPITASENSSWTSLL